MVETLSRLSGARRKKHIPSWGNGPRQWGQISPNIDGMPVGGWETSDMGTRFDSKAKKGVDAAKQGERPRQRWSRYSFWQES